MYSFSTRLHEEAEISDASVVFGTVNLNIGDGYDEFTGKDKSKYSLQLIILHRGVITFITACQRSCGKAIFS